MRLNVGCGGRLGGEGWIDLDRAPGPGRYAHDVRDGLPFPDKTFDDTVAHHVLDQFTWPELLDVLAEIRRTTRGTFRASSADPRAAFAAWQRGDDWWFPEPRDDIGDAFRWFLDQGGVRKVALTPEILGIAVRAGGFDRYTEVQAGKTLAGPGSPICELDARPGESFYIEAW